MSQVPSPVWTGALAVLAVAAPLLATAGAVPQLVRLGRSGDPAGLSPSQCTLVVGSCSGWLAYAAWTSSAPVAASSGAIGLIYLVMVVLLARAGAPVGPALVVGGAWLVVLAASAGIGARAGIGAALAIGGVLAAARVIESVPRVRAAFGPGGTSGIAPATLAVSAVGATAWIVLGLAHGQTMVAASSGVELLALAAITTAHLRPHKPELA